MSNLTIKTETNNLEKFYQGFSFASMNYCGNFIVFKASSRFSVKQDAERAKKRIAEMGLPLEVVPSKFPFDTYIVREGAAA